MSSHPSPDPAVTIRLMSTLALQTFVEDIGSTLGGCPLKAAFAPTKLLLNRLRHGEPADVVLLTKAGVLQLIEEKILDTHYKDIATSSLGIGQASTRQQLDIGTLARLRDVLLDARSIAYSANGASGQLFVELVRRLEIEELVKQKAVVSPDGFTGAFVVSGEAEIAVQQISELRSVNGLGPITPLPEEAQCTTVFTAARPVTSTSPEAFEQILSLFASADGQARLKAVDLTPS